MEMHLSCLDMVVDLQTRMLRISLLRMGRSGGSQRTSQRNRFDHCSAPDCASALLIDLILAFLCHLISA